ncbi:hypothetical protein M2139_001484 [Enterococcus sp. PF1-24]|uniref:MobP2 family relaxase n=1 Tax=unclassified Enterococcus TaxID=2608891 RepID=UPI0024738106|nr:MULTISPECIES: MobP2 family relaxase [unclassified Enterococcus]MDH6364525.1 hypothetical protein [Enterococcus sp. PFB1-1]MDH6401598.1 hypothetical protein [Enterococcus sp. PF1-24]
MSSPAIILTSKFTLKDEFGEYISYMNRERAKKKNNKMIEAEAMDILQNNIFDSLNISNQGESSFEKYLDYLTRKNALEKKEKLSADEQAEYSYYQKKLDNMKVDSHISQEKNDVKKLKTGMFNQSNNDFNREDVRLMKEEFNRAGEKGNILFQDVFSFDTKSLIDLGIYDPIKDELNRQPLIDATRRSMMKFFNEENLNETGFWVAEIHYNTNHFHVHVATSETMNTRSIHEEVINGKTVLQPKGMRSGKTLNLMKSTFINRLIDRSNELDQMTELRNNLAELIRQEKNFLSLDGQLKDVLGSLPKDKRRWVYKRIPLETKQRIDSFLEKYLEKNPKYNKYLELIAEESDFRDSLYAKNKEKKKNNYYQNKLKDIKKRLGNALLKNLKDWTIDEDKIISGLTKEELEKFGNNLGNFSKKNQSIILKKFPEASHLKSRSAWLKEGRLVDKKRGISLMYPKIDQKSKKLIGFQEKKIYDLSNTKKVHDGPITEEEIFKQFLDKFEFESLFDEKEGKAYEENISVYSKNNQKLILDSCPGASHVKTKNGWEIEGKSVNDSDAIMILQPVIDENSKKVVDFQSLAVFDISQTNNKYWVPLNINEAKENSWGTNKPLASDPTIKNYPNNLDLYSEKNQIKIMEQMPTASHVKTKHGWLAEKRVVNENEPIVIMQPILDEDSNLIAGFQPIEVYDCSSTVAMKEKLTIDSYKELIEEKLKEFENEKGSITKPIESSESAYENNLNRFSHFNRKKILEQDSNASAVYSQWSWQNKGYKLIDNASPIYISAPVIDSDDRSIKYFEELTMFDISNVEKMTQKEIKEHNKYSREMQKKYTLAPDYNAGEQKDYQSGIGEVKRQLNNVLGNEVDLGIKDIVNNDYDRKQQINEYERTQKNIEYMKKQQELSH